MESYMVRIYRCHEGNKHQADTIEIVGTAEHLLSGKCATFHNIEELVAIIIESNRSLETSLRQ